VSTTTSSSEVESRNGLGGLIRGLAWRYGMVAVLVILVVLAGILVPDFFAPVNLSNVLAQVAPVGIVAIGMTFVIIAGGFDLSVAAIFAGGTVFYAGLSNSMPLGAAFTITLLFGVLAGVINGVIVTVLRVNTFIATLATSSLFTAVGFLYSNAEPIVSEAKGFLTMGTGKWFGIWIANYIIVVIAIVAAIVLSRTVYGRSVYSVGGNLEASRLAGLRTSWIRVTTYMMSGAAAALGGMIIASQTGVGQMNIGATVALDSITIVIIGGTSLMGGEGAMWRTVVGILIWGVINNIFSTLALSTSTQQFMTFFILLGAVTLDTFSRRIR